MSKTYRIFISHSWNYSDVYNNLKDLLDNYPYFSYIDYSVPKDDPIHTDGTASELYEAIERQIAPCHIVLIVAGVYSTYSDWINKEIKIAQTEFENPKPIVGIKPWGNKNVSSVVSEAASEIVGWNSKSIVEAIRKWSI